MYAKKGANVKIVATLLAIVLLIGGTIGGTIAWLTAASSEVKNTFTTSDIGVKLQETTSNYKMVPGWTIAKNPKAWIDEGSEAAYLFVKVQESANFDDFMTYAIDDGWTLLTDVSGLDETTLTNGKTDTATNDTYVIYRKVTDTTNVTQYSILANDQVTVKDDVTKEMMHADDFTEPTLTFTAYASQLYSSAGTEINVATAWTNVGA